MLPAHATQTRECAAHTTRAHTGWPRGSPPHLMHQQLRAPAAASRGTAAVSARSRRRASTVAPALAPERTFSIQQPGRPEQQSGVSSSEWMHTRARLGLRPTRLVLAMLDAAMCAGAPCPWEVLCTHCLPLPRPHKFKQQHLEGGARS